MIKRFIMINYYFMYIFYIIIINKSSTIRIFEKPLQESKVFQSTLE